MIRSLLIFTALCFTSSIFAKSPNIVFFLVDDLAWSDVGCFGSKFYETPNIDQLAQDGVKFTNAYAACHVCSPTRASILTGKYPARLNLTDWLKGRRDFPFQRLKNVEINQHLPYEEVTIAERLKELDYATGIFGKWHLGKKPSDPTAHGFDIHLPDVPSNWRTFHGPFGMKNFESKKGDYLSDRITDEALVWMEINKEKPFFLYMSHFAVHDPIEGRADLVEKYRKKLSVMEKLDSPDFILEGNPDSPDNPTKEELAELIKTPEYARHGVLPRGTIKIRQKQDNIEFAAMVESVDQSLGRIVSKLEELEIGDDTVVIFFSDNGGMSAINVGNPQRVVSEKNVDKAYSTSCLPLRGAKGWLYEGGVRVPMIVKWPGHSKAGSVVDEPVMSTDFYPTILELIGEKGETPDGQSFITALRGEPFERAPIFWHFPHYSNHGMQSPGGAVRDGDFKLLEYFENGTVQLFNLVDDIGEQNDLSEIEVEKTKQLKEKLHQWRKDVDAKMMKPNPDYDPVVDLCSAPVVPAFDQDEIISDGLILDLDADEAVTLEDGNMVTNWKNQVAGFAAQDFAKYDKGRKILGSGRPTLKKNVAELGGHNSLIFREDELINMNENAFDHLTTGSGYTWFTVMSAYAQTGELVGKSRLKDVSVFFGNLGCGKGPNCAGFWAGFEDDNDLWTGQRNGVSFGRYDANNPKLMGPRFEEDKYYIVAGRLASGIGTVVTEIFVDDATAFGSVEFPVNPKATPSVMAIGTERDAWQHPGKESFHGELARVLMYERPLSEDEMVQTMAVLKKIYFDTASKK